MVVSLHAGAVYLCSVCVCLLLHAGYWSCQPGWSWIADPLAGRPGTDGEIRPLARHAAHQAVRTWELDGLRQQLAVDAVHSVTTLDMLGTQLIVI